MYEKVRFVDNLDEKSFRKKIKEDDDAILLDVRTPVERELIRIPNSIWIDINNPDFALEVDKLDKKKSYYLYCKDGIRSFHAGNYMLRVGFERVYNLRPGILGWKGETESST